MRQLKKTAADEKRNPRSLPFPPLSQGYGPAYGIVAPGHLIVKQVKSVADNASPQMMLPRALHFIRQLFFRFLAILLQVESDTPYYGTTMGIKRIAITTGGSPMAQAKELGQAEKQGRVLAHDVG